ncbi:MAG: pyruvate dehydrogenase complex E1 component subunit beta [Dehalococcoidia bacterium]
MSRMTYADAVRLALAQEMRRDPRVWALGEDLSTAAGSTSASQYLGLIDEFGPRRIVNTPISESTIMGAAVGAAMAGSRPLVDLRMADFAVCAMDEIVNQAAKVRYMFGGQARASLVARLPIGVRAGAAAQHSQSTEAWFVHVPGLVVVTPATPADGKGLLKAAIRNDDPVIFMEHKTLWGLEGEVAEDDEAVEPLGVARIVREGADVTVVTWSRMVHVAEGAAATLAQAGVSVEVIDLRTLWPWDREAVFASVRKTGRLVVAQEAVQVGGFGGEVAAEVSEHLFTELKAPVRRLGAPRIPTPYAETLEDVCWVTESHIVAAVNQDYPVRSSV